MCMVQQNNITYVPPSSAKEKQITKKINHDSPELKSLNPHKAVEKEVMKIRQNEEAQESLNEAFSTTNYVSKLKERENKFQEAQKEI